MIDDGDYVASFDQRHAEALERLRGAETFLVAVVDEAEERQAGAVELHVVVIGGGDHFVPFRRSLAESLGINLNEANAEVIEELYVEQGRLKFWRALMMTVCGINLCFVAWNIVVLLTR